MTDLAIAPVAGTLGDYADPAAFVEIALTRAKEWLTQCVEHGDIESIVELKSQAEALRVYTTQKQLGKDAELSAAEIVRRAERGLGLAIRKGQAEGSLRSNGVQAIRQPNSTSPKEFFKNGEEWSDAYSVTDNVTDDEFEQAINEAREERNLSRANVVRKVKGEDKPKPADRSDWHYRTVHIKAERVIDEAIALLDGIASGLAVIEGDVADLDMEKRLAWIEALRQPLKAINRFSKELAK